MRNQLSISILLLLILGGCKEPTTTTIPNDSNESPALPKTTAIIPVEPVDENRYAWQKPGLVIDKLGVTEGKIIADVGAGTGYFSFRLMNKAAKVIAVDIDPDMLQLIDIFRQNLDSLQREKIETRLATADSPMLLEQEVDIAFIVNTIGYIEDRSAYLGNLRNSLKEDGEVMIVDFKMKTIPGDIAPPIEYRVSLLELENLLLEAGYKSILTDDRSLDYQYIVKARRD